MMDADLADLSEKAIIAVFRTKRIYFTNPIEWKESSTGDKSENYLADWYADRNNILKPDRLIRQHCMEVQKQYCITQYVMTVYGHLSKLKKLMVKKRARLRPVLKKAIGRK